MSQLIKGELVVLDIWDGSAYKPVGGLTSNTLSATRNVIEAQIKDNPGTHLGKQVHQALRFLLRQLI